MAVPNVASSADAALAPIARPPTAIAAAAIVEKTFFNDMVSLPFFSCCYFFEG